jgi:hypothetical protein
MSCGIPCGNKSICVDPANPIANTSAEAPDLNIFIGSNTFFAGDPPVDTIFTTKGCESQCTSTISQADADLCAANQQVLCTTQDGGPGGNGDGWVDPRTGNKWQPCFNQQQTCDVLCPDGLPFAFTVPGGSVLGTDCGQANNAALSIACAEAVAKKICLSAITPNEVCVGQKYKGSITATGAGLSPINTIWLNPGGGLPPGINMDFSIGGTTLTISGTATTAGNYPFTITVVTPAGTFFTKNYTICVIDITPTSLPNAAPGVAYSQQLSTPCGTQPLNWQIVSGSLPTGLKLNQQTGIISGTTVTGCGNFTFTVQVQTAAT